MSQSCGCVAVRARMNHRTGRTGGTPGRVLGAVALVWLLATIVIGLQSWLGDQTIYSRALETKREVFHFAILANEAPGGAGWGAVGALSIQKRVGVVYLAEALRKFTGLAIGKVYKVLDTLFLFVSLLSLFFYLRKWVPDIYCLLGVLYFCTALPLTYFFQLFHPWDRLQLTIWIALLWLVADRRFVLLMVGLLLSVLVKFDTILLPFFYLLANISRNHWRRTALESLVLLVLAFGAYLLVGRLFPAPLDNAGFDLNNAHVMLLRNLQMFADLNLRFPPLLVHALPVLLSLLFLRSKPRFVWTSVVFALGLTAVYMLFSNFEEVRAHMVVLVLVLPSALISLRCFLEPGAGAISRGHSEDVQTRFSRTPA